MSNSKIEIAVALVCGAIGSVILQIWGQTGFLLALASLGACSLVLAVYVHHKNREADGYLWEAAYSMYDAPEDEQNAFLEAIGSGLRERAADYMEAIRQSESGGSCSGESPSSRELRAPDE